MTYFLSYSTEVRFWHFPMRSACSWDHRIKQNRHMGQQVNYVLVFGHLTQKNVYVDAWMKARPVNHPLYSLREMTSLPTTSLLSLARPLWTEWNLRADRTGSAKTCLMWFHLRFWGFVFLIGVGVRPSSVQLAHQSGPPSLCCIRSDDGYLWRYAQFELSSLSSQTASAMKVSFARPQIRFS